MAESHVMSALRHKRGDVAGAIVAAERRINDLRACLVHLDATLKLFAGDEINPEAIPARLPRPTPTVPALSGRGDLTRAVLDVLRRADFGLSTADIAEHVAVALGLDFDNGRRHVAFVEQVRNALYRQRDRDIIVNVRDGLRVLWRIADAN